MENFKNILENKIIKILWRIIKWIFIAIILAFVVIVYLQKLSKNEVSFFNYRMFTVVTASMEPRYNVGDVLFAKEVEPSKIKVGDDISYKGLTGDVRDKIITHEVIDIEQENGEYYFHAKGLTNLIQDPIVHEKQLYGVISHKSAILSFISKIVRTDIGFFLCILVPIIGIITYELVTTLLVKEEKRRSKTD